VCRRGGVGGGGGRRRWRCRSSVCRWNRWIVGSGD
jgi:hypothetical protein